MKCPRISCGGTGQRVIYAGFPGHLCPECSTAWGLAGWAAVAFDWLGMFDGMFFVFPEKTWYPVALFWWFSNETPSS